VDAEFDYEKDRYDVVQVNETAYATCDGSSPILSYSRGRNFVFRLNTTGRLYFICSRGYCWNGMKVSVLVRPAPPPPAAAPSTSHASRARPRRGRGLAVGGSHCLGGRGGAFTGVNGKAQALGVLPARRLPDCHGLQMFAYRAAHFLQLNVVVCGKKISNNRERKK